MRTASVAPTGAVNANGALPVTSVSASWHDFGQRNGLNALSRVSSRYVVRQSEDGRNVSVERRSDHKIVLKHQADSPDYEPTFADVAGDTLVVAEEDVHGDKGPAHSYVYDLVTGHRTAVGDIKSAPPLSVFGAQASVTDDGRYYYQATAGDGANLRTCVGLLDLKTLRGSSVECAKDADGQVGYFVSPSQEGAAWMNWTSPAKEGCRTGRAVRAGQVVDVATVANCELLASVTVGDWDVWASTPSRGSQWPAVVPIRAVNATQVVELGLVDGVTLYSCGGYAYWRLTNEPQRTVELRRWKPGNPSVETVYSLDDPADLPGIRTLVPFGCTDNIFTLVVETGQPKTGDHVQTLALEPPPAG